MTATSTGLRVVVAVLTYQRPDDLAEVLPLLLEQADTSPADVSVLVVDNDPAGGARDQCAALPAVRYVHEPHPGIAAARQRALDESADRDVLVFIDDDERPGPAWLDHLLRTWTGHDCAGVVGPVVSSFDVPPDPWIVAGGFFTRRRLPTGTEVSVAATNNLLLDLRVVARLGLCFDDRFGLTGGSDSLFTRQLTDAGARLVWCDEAVVTDVVPRSRCTRGWVLRRRLRMGTSLSRTELAVAPSARARGLARARLTGQGAVRVAGGALRLGLGYLVRDVRHQATGARTLARGCGILTGAYGHAYVEYRRPVPAGG